MKSKSKKHYTRFLNNHEDLEFVIFLAEKTGWYNQKYNKNREMRIIIDIVNNNHTRDGDELLSLYHKYKDNNDRYECLAIRYGEAHAEKMKTVFSNRRRPENTRDNTRLCPEYWLKRGYKEEEASELAIAEAREMHRKSYENREPLLPGEMKKRHKHCVEYWLEKGYDVEEAENLKSIYVQKCMGTLANSIEKHGEVLGRKKFEERQEKRKNTLIERYGTHVISAKVSKESLYFFVPLYKKLRKHGISKDDIMWGIKGSREFGTQYEGKNYLYDFCIKSKKIIIEYNNSFWHYNPSKTQTKNPFLSEKDMMEKDELKKHIVEEMGFQIYYVWEDDDKQKMIQYLFEVITNEK